MNSFDDLDRLESDENNLNNFLDTYSQQKYSEIELVGELSAEDSKFNELKHTQFLKIIKKQINDLIYKDQQIGYNILLIDEKIKFEEESNSTISLDCNKLMQSKKNMNEQIQKIHQKLVKQITTKGQTHQKFENTKKFLSEVQNKKIMKDNKLSEISHSVEQYEMMKGENLMLKKNLNEDIDFLGMINKKQELIISDLNHVSKGNPDEMKHSLVHLKNIQVIVDLMKKKEALEKKKEKMKKKMQKFEKLKFLEDSYKKKEYDFLHETQMNYDKKISELLLKTNDFNQQKKNLIELRNKYLNEKENTFASFQAKIKSNKEQISFIEALKANSADNQSHLEINKNFSMEIKTENINLEEFLTKFFHDKKNILTNLEQASFDELNKRSIELKIYNNKLETITRKYENLKNQTNQYSQVLLQLNEDIHVKKFDLNLILNEDASKTFESKTNDDILTSFGNYSIAKNSIITSDDMTKFHQMKKRSEESCLSIKKPIRKTHRIIKSMKLEFNELNKKMKEDRIICFPPLENSYEPHSKKKYRQSSETFQNKNLSKILVKKKKHEIKFQEDLISFKKFNESINKLKEQNILYSNLFHMRIKRKNSKKINEKKNLVEELYHNRIISDQVIEKNMGLVKEKEKKIEFSFQIFILLIFTLGFTIVKQEVKIAAKVMFFPFRILSCMNELFSLKKKSNYS